MLTVQMELQDWQALVDMLMQAPLPFVVTNRLLSQIDPQLEDQEPEYLQKDRPPPRHAPDGNGSGYDTGAEAS